MQCNYIELGGKCNDKFRRNIIIKEDEKENKLKNLQFTDTYCTIYKYDNKKQDMANIIAPLYIDLDVDDLEHNFNKIKTDVMLLTRKLKVIFNLTNDNIELFFSGSKGFHILIPYEVFGFQPSKDLNTKFKAIALELQSYTITKSIDTKIYDTKRLFREVNTINSKTGLYKVPLTVGELRNMTYEQLIDYASSPKYREDIEVNKEYNEKADIAFNKLIEELSERQKRTINHRVARKMLENKELLPCVKYILQNGAVNGQRNNTAVALASALFQREPDNLQGIRDIMNTWNETKLQDPIDRTELYNTVQSAYMRVKEGKGYGCNSFIDLGVCVKGCPVRNKR